MEQKNSEKENVSAEHFDLAVLSSRRDGITYHRINVIGYNEAIVSNTLNTVYTSLIVDDNRLHIRDEPKIVSEIDFETKIEYFLGTARFSVNDKEKLQPEE